MKWQQTNTADMLDLAVDYIKDLQKQVQVTTKKIKFASSPSNTHMNFPPAFLFPHQIYTSLMQTLTDKKATCSCPSKQLQCSNGTT